MENTFIKKQRPKRKHVKKIKENSIDVTRFSGTIRWNEDPVKYQRGLRDGK